jgi:hypothetical protein
MSLLSFHSQFLSNCRLSEANMGDNRNGKTSGLRLIQYCKLSCQVFWSLPYSTPFQSQYVGPRYNKGGVQTIFQEQLGAFLRSLPPSWSLVLVLECLQGLCTHQGATLPLGGLPQKSVNCLSVLSSTSACCSMVMAFGFL